MTAICAGRGTDSHQVYAGLNDNVSSEQSSKAQCQKLEESFQSLDEIAALLQQGTDKARGADVTFCKKELGGYDQEEEEESALPSQAAAAPGAAAAIKALKAALAGKVDDPELSLGKRLQIGCPCFRRCEGLSSSGARPWTPH